MSRLYNQATLQIIKNVSQFPGISAKELFSGFSKTLNNKSFYNTIYRLVKQGLLQTEGENKKIRLTISGEGIKLVNLYNPQKDGVWKLVIFDIPEKRKKVRDALRGHLRQIGFYELQKSVFIHPYPCGDEIEFLVEFHQVRAHVRQLTVHAIDNDLHLRRKFNVK